MYRQTARRRSVAPPGVIVRAQLSSKYVIDVRRPASCDAWFVGLASGNMVAQFGGANPSPHSATTESESPTRAPLFTLMAASLAAITACSQTVPTGIGPSGASLAASKAVVTEPTSGPCSRIVEGETGPGSLYAIYVPRQPNGDAVLYAHGIRDAYRYVTAYRKRSQSISAIRTAFSPFATCWGGWATPLPTRAFPRTASP
jgi:hypothetical protein